MMQDADVASLEAIVGTVYQLISGRANEPRDWGRLRTLYSPGARLMPVRIVEGEAIIDMLDVDTYESTRKPIFAAADFYEVETGHRIERFGDVAHVWSAYEARRSADAAPFMRGINSFQLVHRESRWWILSVLWQNEQDGLMVPTEQGGW
jgi:hypothetical protein